MIDAIFWDVGGVFSGRPIDAIASVAAEHDLDADAVFAAIFGPYHLDGDHSWHRVERGEISLKDAWADIEAAIAAFGIELTLADFFRRFGDDPHDRTIVTETLRELHGRGIAMGLITNPAIYRHALASLGVDATRAVFLDDMATNVDAAVAIGMHGIVVDEPGSAMAELRALVDRLS